MEELKPCQIIPCDQELLFYLYLQQDLGYLQDPRKQNVRTLKDIQFHKIKVYCAHDFQSVKSMCHCSCNKWQTQNYCLFV